jgi:lysophospholipase L1-like esterase
MQLRSVYKAALILSLFCIAARLPSGTSRLVLLLFLMAELAVVFKRSVIGGDKKEWVKNSLTALFTVLFLFLGLECCFMYIRRSNAFGDTLASRLWFDTYWKPINSYGFRDAEPARDTASGIFFLGDSFTAGHGIKNTGDRFSDIVRAKMQANGVPTTVINLGRQGADTRDEYQTMTGFIASTGKRPSSIVLQYFGNDIEEVAKQCGMRYTLFQPYGDLHPAARYVIKRSFFLNYLYWMVPGRGYSSYFDFLEKSYANDSIFNRHKQDLEKFIGYSRENHIPLLVVVFPFMQDPGLSKRVYADKLERWFDQNGVAYIDVAALTGGMPVRQRVVNGNDAHASVAVNRLVGNAVYDRLYKESYVKVKLPK